MLAQQFCNSADHFKIYSLNNVLACIGIITVWRLYTLIAYPLGLSFDEAQYWIWAQTPSWGYFSKPPIIAWVIFTTTSFCGDIEPCVRFGSPIAYFVASLAIYKTGKYLYNTKIGFWSALVFLTLPGVVFSSILINTDPFLIMFWALSLLVLIYALSTESIVWWSILGCLIGLGFLTKYAMVFFVISLYLFLANIKKQALKTLGPWLSVGISIVVFFPNLLWNVTKDFVTFQHTMNNINIQWQALFHPIESLTFIGSVFLIFGPVQTVILFFLVQQHVVIRAQKKIDVNTTFLLSFTLPILVAMGVESFLSRVHANWSAPAFVSATILIVAWCTHYNFTNLLRFVVAIHLFFSIVFYNPEKFSIPLGNLLNHLKRLHDWDIAGHEILCIHLNYKVTPLLFDNRKALAPIVYYTRPTALDSVIWSNSNSVHNHFEMTTRLHKGSRQNCLFVTEQSDAIRIVHSFIKTRPIVTLRTRPGLTRKIQILFCDTFRGYHNE